MLAGAPRANSLFSGWEGQRLRAEKSFHSPSFCWLADVQTPGLDPSDRLCTQPIL